MIRELGFELVALANHALLVCRLDFAEDGHQRFLDGGGIIDIALVATFAGCLEVFVLDLLALDGDKRRVQACLVARFLTYVPVEHRLRPTPLLAGLRIGVFETLDAGSLFDQQLQLLVGHLRQVGHRFLARVDRGHEHVERAAHDAIDDLLGFLLGALRHIDPHAGSVVLAGARCLDNSLVLELLVLAVAGDPVDGRAVLERQAHVAILLRHVVDDRIAGLVARRLPVDCPTQRIDDGRLADPVAGCAGVVLIDALNEHKALAIERQLFSVADGHEVVNLELEKFHWIPPSGFHSTFTTKVPF